MHNLDFVPWGFFLPKTDLTDSNFHSDIHPLALPPPLLD